MAKELCVSVGKGKIHPATVLKDLTDTNKQIVSHIKGRQCGKSVQLMTIKDLLESPVSAFRGIDDESGTFLQTIGCPIKSIRKLGQWKFARWAQRIVEKAAEE